MTRKRLHILASLLLTVLIGQGCQSHRTGEPPPQNTALAREQNDAAYALIKDGKYDRAAEVLKAALEADVMYGPAHNNLGIVYEKLHKPLYDAAWEFEKAIKLMPHQPEARNNLGRVLEQAGKLSEATDAFARAHEMEPDNPEYIGNLANVRLERKMLDQETRKLLEELIFRDHRADRIQWARDQLIRIPPPGQDIIVLPSTRPAKG